MEGDKDIINLLNEQLTAELTAINQYFLHAKMQQNWGFTRIAKHTRHESIDEMKHAELLTDRILFLEGLPNYQKLGTLRIGQTVVEQLKADLQVELEAVARLRPGIELMRSRGDVTSARIFEKILEDEEYHIDYLETELSLVESLGEQNYLQRLTEAPGEDAPKPIADY
ncbi:bacterioferritin [Spirillospora sp. NPDC029432]|uniref:bacterioferritin n=1 Tax=Spirillospora sp. NPDC029432 TaxID=3154599 RepID=UPI003451C67E